MSATNVLPGKEPLTLSDKNIPKAFPGDDLWDVNVRGLHLRCGATKKTFYLYYRTKAGVQRKPKLGDYGTITLSQARKLAGEMWVEIGAGRDPSQKMAAGRSEHTLDDLFFECRKRIWGNKKTAGEDLRVWEKFFHAPAADPGQKAPPKARFHSLAMSKLSDLDFGLIADMHVKLTEVSGPIQANRILALLSTMFRFGIAPLEWCAKNLTTGVMKNPETKRKRYKTDDESRKIEAIFRKKALDKHNIGSLAFLYLVIFTGARKGEIAKAMWTDLHGNKIVLTEHKTDQDDDVRTIHLPPAAMLVIEQLPRTNGTITGVKNPKKLWEAIRMEAGCPDLRLHDLRHSFAASALANGLTLGQVGELLGHKSYQTTKRYTHLNDKAAIIAASSTVDRIVASMAPTTPE